MKTFFIFTLLFFFTSLFAEESLAASLADTLQEGVAFSFDSRSTFYRNTGEARGDALFTFQNQNSRIKQHITYETFTDHAAKIGRYHLLLAGENIHTLTPHFDMGFEWLPSFYHSKFDYLIDTVNTVDSGYGVVSLSLGPVLAFDIVGLPLRVSGGGAVDVWNDQLKYSLAQSHAAGTVVDGGGYFSVWAGGMEQVLFDKVPLYAEGSAFGRYMQSSDNSNFTRGDIKTAYLADSVLGAESLVVVIGDTLLHGRLGGVYTYSGGGRSVNQPPRVNNSFATTIDWLGLGYGKWFVTPSIYLSMYDGRYRYLYPKMHSGIYSSRARTRVSGTLDLHRHFGKKFTVRGGLTFAGGHDEFFYESNFVGYTGGNVLTPLQVDSATVKLNDADIFSPSAYFSMKASFHKRWVVSYLYEVNRERTLHPFYYVQQVDTVQLSDDIDNGRRLHRLSLEYAPRPWYTFEFAGEYARSQLNFLSPQKSAGSRIDTRIKLDVRNIFSVDSTFYGHLILGSVVTPQEYLYGTSASSRPTHARRFYGLTKAEYSFGRGLGALVRVDYYYRDLGVLQDEYYGISEKNYELTGTVGLSYIGDTWGTVTIGSDYKRQRIARWSAPEDDWVDWVDDTIVTPDTTYISRRRAIVYQFAPYVMVRMHLSKGLSLRGKIKYYIDRVGNKTDNYWDVALTLTVEK